MTAQRVQFVTHEGMRIAFRVSGQGPPILIDGPLTNLSIEAETAEARDWYAALGHEFQVIRIDRPLGGGLSSGANGSAVAGPVIDAALTAVPAALGVGPTALLAWADGAQSALKHAAESPAEVSAVVLLNPLWRAVESHTLRWEAAASNPALHFDSRLRGGLGSTPPEGLRERTRELVLARHPPELAANTRYSREEIADLNSRATEIREQRARTIAAPTLVLHRTEQLSFPLAESVDLASMIPEASLETVPGDALLPWLDPERKALEAIQRFLRGVLGTSAESVEGSRLDGLQTILFTDLVGSTAMQSRLGDEGAREVLRAHDAAVRQAIGEFSGREVKHTGDGMMTAFGSAADAVNCALTVRRDIATYNDTQEGEELLVRFGLNAGEPIAEDDDLFGLSVTLAARIGDWGEPGQVLCSNVVRELLLGKGFEFTSVGKAELKGFDEPVAVFEVRA